MEFRLAALLGRTVSEMRASLSVSEWQGWQRYWREEPWGPWRDNAHAGLVASTIASVYRKKGAKPFTFDQFILKNEQVSAEDNLADLTRKFRAMARPRSEREAELKQKRKERKQKRRGN